MTSHLDALQVRLSNERIRLAKATGTELLLREVYVRQIENEISRERYFDGIENDISDEELLKELES